MVFGVRRLDNEKRRFLILGSRGLKLNREGIPFQLVPRYSVRVGCNVGKRSSL